MSFNELDMFGFGVFGPPDEDGVPEHIDELEQIIEEDRLNEWEPPFSEIEPDDLDQII